MLECYFDILMTMHNVSFKQFLVLECQQYWYVNTVNILEIVKIYIVPFRCNIINFRSQAL